jgi:NADPH:quinone reductase-like Zn-dependent oxidoreductase
MKAVILREHGPIENMSLVDDHPKPEPGPGQVRIRIHALALNRLDWWMRVGVPGFKLEFPHILGADAAGTIDKLGEGVKGWQVGDRVALDPGEVDCTGCEFCERGMENWCRSYAIIGEHVGGTHCEYRNYPVRNLVALPGHVEFTEAAAASLVYLTAWHSMITRGALKPGESVLIVGASGGVNTASLQIAKMLGCTTYVVGSDSQKCVMAEELGADYVFDRSQDDDWGRAVFKTTQKRGVDVVIDNVGAATMMTSIRALRPGGRVLTVGNTSGPEIQIDNRFVFHRHASIIGSTMGPHADYVDVMRLIFASKLKAVIGASFAVEDFAEAHRVLEENEIFGKIVLEVN